MPRDIDTIIAELRRRIPELRVSQLPVKFPGVDDDGIWYFQLPGKRGEIQIESSSGMCPFLIEHSGMRSNSEAAIGKSTDEVVRAVSVYLAEL